MSLTDKDIEWIARGLAAETIRAYMQDGKGMATIARRAGVNPYTSRLPHGIHGTLMFGDNAAAIVVDENLTADGTRYWLAHMLAHYLAALERVCGAERLRPGGQVECGDGGHPYIRDGYDCYATPMEPTRLLAGYLDTYLD